MIKIFLVPGILSVISAQSLYNDSIDITNNSGELCDRTCGSADYRRICYFKFTLENYATMGPACKTCGSVAGKLSDCFNDQCVTTDGVERAVLTINRQLPSPSIFVCERDLVVIDVVNMMMGYETTIHWHGFHQKDYPWMDGVPMITQCPINSGNTFRYKFWASESGTHWYHSHSGHQKSNGIFGGIVVRKHVERHASLYDNDSSNNLIVLSDWKHELAETHFPGLRTQSGGLQPANLLVNGKGTTRHLDARKSTTGTPLAVYYVQKNRRYRFRLVNAGGLTCPVLLEIEGHKMTVIASDSNDLQPTTVSQLVSNAGERFDFVVNANQSGVDYWMRFRALGSCEANQIEQYAVLTYRDPNDPQRDLHAYPQNNFPAYDSSYGDGSIINFPNTTCGNPSDNEFCISDLSSYVTDASVTVDPPQETFFLGFTNVGQSLSVIYKKNSYGNMYTSGDLVTVGAINNITFSFSTFPLLTQREMIGNTTFCDKNNLPESCTSQKICTCTHRLKIPLNRYVEMVIVDETTSIALYSHPFHIHGISFYVLEMGQHPDKIPMTVELAKTMNLGRNMTSPQATRQYPLKDTISIPSRGFVRIRFKATNPGFWFMHCHYESHMATGMNLVLQVGETHQMLEIPENFPKCGNYESGFLQSEAQSFREECINIS